MQAARIFLATASAIVVLASAALAKMKDFDFLCEPPLALPIETTLAG